MTHDQLKDLLEANLTMYTQIEEMQKDQHKWDGTISQDEDVSAEICEAYRKMRETLSALGKSIEALGTAVLRELFPKR